MKVVVFSSRCYEQPFLIDANRVHQHDLIFFEERLDQTTAFLAKGALAVSCFVTDDLSASVLEILAKNGTRLIALRSAGFNHVDLVVAKALGLIVVRVPAYSPYAVAEFAVALILALNRKIHVAYDRVKKQNFLLDDLLGFDLRDKIIGIIGTGRIGAAFAKIMSGFGCRLVAYDPYPNTEISVQLRVEYLSLEELLQKADIVSLHCPLTNESHHMINQQRIALMKPGIMLINTARGALMDTAAVIEGLKSKVISSLAMDVYEKEAPLFFQDFSNKIIQDDVFVRLQAFPNVLITAHQAFLTKEALTNIATSTLDNVTFFEQNKLELCHIV